MLFSATEKGEGAGVLIHQLPSVTGREKAINSLALPACHGCVGDRKNWVSEKTFRPESQVLATGSGCSLRRHGRGCGAMRAVCCNVEERHLNSS